MTTPEERLRRERGHMEPATLRYDAIRCPDHPYDPECWAVKSTGPERRDNATYLMHWLSEGAAQEAADRMAERIGRH